MRRKFRPALVVAAVALAGCGADEATDTASTSPTTAASVTTAAPATSAAGGTAPATTAAPTTTAAAAAAGATIVPAVDVTDVVSGNTVALRTAMARDKPTLIWMWAPH